MTGAGMRVACIGNMNHIFFSLARFLRDRGVDADLRDLREHLHGLFCPIDAGCPDDRHDVLQQRRDVLAAAYKQELVRMALAHHIPDRAKVGRHRWDNASVHLEKATPRAVVLDERAELRANDGQVCSVDHRVVHTH